MLASLAWSLSNLKITFNLYRGVRGYDFHHFIFYGDDLMRIKIALALMSAIFMHLWATILIGLILYSLSIIITFFPVYTVLIDLLSIISFLGSVLFLLEARKVLPRWYLGIPLCISLFLMVIVKFGIVFSDKSSFGERFIVETLFISLMALLPPFSALVFLSLRKHIDSMNACLAVSYVASIVSILFLFLILSVLSKIQNFGHIEFLQYDEFLIPIRAILGYIVMPIIGICFLVRAITYKNPGNVLSPVTDESTQN